MIPKSGYRFSDKIMLIKLVRRMRWRVRLLQRMLGGERIQRHAGRIDAAGVRIVGRIAPEQHLGAGEVRGEAEVGDRHLLADAELAGPRVADQRLLDSLAREIDPVPYPFHARRLVEA